MAKDPTKIKKLYYSIGEVSKITELKQYVPVSYTHLRAHET